MLLPLLSLSSGQSQKIVFNGLRVTKTFYTRDVEEGIFFFTFSELALIVILYAASVFYPDFLHCLKGSTTKMLSQE